MTDRQAIQAPLDLSAWIPVDLGEEEEAAGKLLDTDALMKMAAETEEETLSEDDQLKAALLRQQHVAHFEAPDPSDVLTDDQLWELMPESIRRNS